MKVRTIFTIIAAGVLVLALLTTRGGFSRMQILSHKFPAISGHTAMPPPGTSFEPSTGYARVRRHHCALSRFPRGHSCGQHADRQVGPYSSSGFFDTNWPAVTGRL